ncbi:plasma serine protease inhibitor-like [Anomaloglossus baeobatrachus]
MVTDLQNMRVFLFLGAALLFPLVFAADDSTTGGEISELLHRVDQDLIIDLNNYIYERAKWENPFDTKWAKEGEFHIDEKKIVKMPFISRKRRYKVAFTDEATVVSIPCNGDTDALFILPETGEAFEIQQKVNEEAIHSWEKSMHKRDVDIFLPKFSVAGTYHLRPAPHIRASGTFLAFFTRTGDTC